MLRDEIAKYTELSGNDGWHTPICVIGAYLDGYDKGLELSVSENSNKWIPVSERLPEDYDRVLITVNGCRGLIVREARYCKAQNEFEVLHNHERWEVGEKGLLAWMPLPEPYKAEKGGE